MVGAAVGGRGGCEDRVRIGKERGRKVGGGGSSTRENIPQNCDYGLGQGWVCSL